MSRCFPYPPPGYTRNGIRDEALIHSIKLQREAEKAKKEGKKEKKQKKEKEKARQSGEDNRKKHRQKRRHRDEKNHENENDRDSGKKKRRDAEQLEKSSITEEHANPAGSQNSSDNSLNCKRKQNQSSSSDDKQNTGSIIRIRLAPMQRHKDSEVLTIKGQPPSALEKSDNPSIEGITERPTEKAREQPKSELVRPDCPLDEHKEESAFVTGRQAHPCSTSGSTGQELYLTAGKEGFLCHGSSESSISRKTTAHSGLCRRCPSSFALQLRDLVENWDPPQLQTECTDLETDSWLYRTNGVQGTERAKRCDMGITGSLSFLNATSWPSARHLPEADIYVLPFTIPF